LPKPGKVSLKIYDSSGRLVVTLVDGNKEAGYHEVSWSSKSGKNNLPSGVYFCKLATRNRYLTRKIVLLRLLGLTKTFL